MQEEYLLEKMIKGKTDKEKEIELIQSIIETKERTARIAIQATHSEKGRINDDGKCSKSAPGNCPE